MHISLKDASGDLANLCARAQAGEEVTITLGASGAIRLTPVVSEDDASLAQTRRELLEGLAEAGARKATPGPCAARSQDWLYDEYGAPA